MSELDCHLELGVAGELHLATSIRLYPATMVAEWRGQIARAQEALGPTASGFFVAGSPGFVAGASLLMSALDGLTALGKAAEAQRALHAAEVLQKDLRSAGHDFPIQDITGLDQPEPSAWAAEVADERYVHTGDDFLTLVAKSGAPLHLRWSHVSTFRAVVNGQAIAAPTRQPSTAEKVYFLG